MIFFPQLGSLGRLGNQLFQYAALRGVCLKNNYETVLPNLNQKIWHGQISLLNEFNIKGRTYKKNIILYKYIEPSWKFFDPKFLKIKDNSIIEGFFQNLYYFEEFEYQIKKELTPKEKYIKNNIDFIKNIKKQYDCEIVSVHLRRGDNLLGLNDKYNDTYQAMYNKNGVYFQYFEKAKEVFKNKKVKFLIFTGGNRGNENNIGDMEWCKTIFVGDEYLFSENQKQIDDFTRIMLCDHNILSHISSFGWWAAYLNRNKNKVVVAPKYYHPDVPNLIRDKFYPNEYILI